MSPEKVTIIFRDGWDPINPHSTPNERKIAEKIIERQYKELGIELNFQKLTFVDI